MITATSAVLCNLALIGAMVGCESAPPVPEHVKFGVHANLAKPGFYGVNSKTKARVFKSFDDPEMKGAQCVTADDYRALEAWAHSLHEYLRERCN